MDEIYVESSSSDDSTGGILETVALPVINTQISTESYQGQEMDQGRDQEVDQWGDPGSVQDSFQNQNREEVYQNQNQEEGSQNQNHEVGSQNQNREEGSRNQNREEGSRNQNREEGS